MSGILCAFRYSSGNFVDPVGKIGQIAMKAIQRVREAESPPDRVEIQRAHDTGLPQPAERFRESEMPCGQVLA